MLVVFLTQSSNAALIDTISNQSNNSKGLIFISSCDIENERLVCCCWWWWQRNRLTDFHKSFFEANKRVMPQKWSAYWMKATRTTIIGALCAENDNNSDSWGLCDVACAFPFWTEGQLSCSHGLEANGISARRCAIHFLQIVDTLFANLCKS